GMGEVVPARRRLDQPILVGVIHTRHLHQRHEHQRQHRHYPCEDVPTAAGFGGVEEPHGLGVPEGMGARSLAILSHSPPGCTSNLAHSLTPLGILTVSRLAYHRDDSYPGVRKLASSHNQGGTSMRPAF